MVLGSKRKERRERHVDQTRSVHSLRKNAGRHYVVLFPWLNPPTDTPQSCYALMRCHVGGCQGKEKKKKMATAKSIAEGALGRPSSFSFLPSLAWNHMKCSIEYALALICLIDHFLGTRQDGTSQSFSFSSFLLRPGINFKDPGLKKREKEVLRTKTEPYFFSITRPVCPTARFAILFVNNAVGQA